MKKRLFIAILPGLMLTWSLLPGFATAQTAATQISGFGTVTAIDHMAYTMSLNVLGSSRLLKTGIGSGAQTDFSLASTVKVTGARMGPGWMMGGPSGGTMMPGTPGPGYSITNLTVNNIQLQDFVWFYGYQDNVRKSFIVTQLMVWLN